MPSDKTKAVEEEAEYLRKCIEIEPVALEEEFIRTPADVAYWHARYADALEVALRAKAAADAAWARLWLLRREELIASGTKPTEKMVDAAVEGDPEWQAARLSLIEAESRKARLYGHVEAVRTKKDMLQSLGAKMRAELGSEPQVRAEQRAVRDASGR